MRRNTLVSSTLAVAALASGTSLFAGLAETATAAPLPQVTSTASTASMKSAWGTGTAPVAVTVASRAITKYDVGATIQLRVTDDSSSTLQCTSWKLNLVKGGVTTAPAADLSASGCFTGGANIVATITSDMVGGTLKLTTHHVPATGVAAVTMTGKVTIRTTVVELSTKVARPSATTTPAPAPSTTPTPTPAPSTTPSAPTVGAAQGSNLDTLPRIAWEGGSAYYTQFADTRAAGWTSSSHFPIAVWWGRAGTDAQVKNAKALGINTFMILNDGTDANLLKANGMSYIGKNALQNMSRGDSTWAGDFLEDESDAWGGDNVLNILQGKASALPDHNKFRYANFTAMTYSWYQNNPTHDSLMKAAVNNYSDVVSSDAYWYLSGQCDSADPHGDAYATPFTKANCRTPQAYGRNVTSLRWRDAQDGKLQPVWNFIENISGGTDDGVVHYTQTGEQIEGAAMSSIIHEARGLVWFDQSFGNTPCASGDAVGDYINPAYPAQCKALVASMGKVNNLIQSLAPVLNTQSYVWNFGTGTETMLKSYNGAAYVFAMPTDAGTNSGAGTKTFTVPAALKGKTITVVGENRTIPMNADGTFSDSFASLSSYHVYKIA